MLMLGDLDLNSVPRCTDSLKEVVKLTMLEQEVVFRKQVHELHQLYWQQESLMKDLAYTGCNRYTPCNSKAQCFLPSLTNPTRHETLAKEARFSSVPEEESKPLGSWEVLEEHQGTYCGLQKRSPVLQLSADEFINHVEEHQRKKENVWNHVKENMDLEHPACTAFSLVPEELKLSLSIQPDNTRSKDTMANLFDKKTDCFSQRVIDLEDSAKRMSEGYEKSKRNSTSKLESQVSDFVNPIILTSEKKDSFHPISTSGSFRQPSECCQGQIFSGDGIRKCYDDIKGNGPSVEEQQSIPHQRRHLDLNENLDHSSCYTNDPMLATPTAASSADGSTGFISNFQRGTFPITFWEKEVNKSSSKKSDIIEEDNCANFAHMDLNSARETEETSIRIPNCNEGSCGKVSLIGPDSTSRPPVGMFECVGRCSSNHRNENADLKSNHVNDVSHNSQHFFTATGEVNSQKSVECTGFPCTDCSQNKFQDQRSNNPPAQCKSFSISDTDTSSGKTAHSCITTDVSNQHSSANIGSQVADVLSGACNQRTVDSGDLNNKCSDKQQKWAEADNLIQEAAESLICISLCNSACYQDFSTKAGSKEPKVDKQEQPHYSSDTFELIALQLTENNLTDDSASSKPLEVNDAESKNFGLKLRRGRRLKDFQREILPGLASLSVHEIQEDITIMEGALRSREYRKIRAMMGNLGENYSPLTRSKRSRHNYATRRNSWRKLS
uniref:Uncharacterized protein n=1 Tax=Rhizophora mucronata TaxID=61149 RepID=A0A2P2Q2U2_RHIMU